MLHSETRSLGQPRAALLAFGVAALAYNVLSVLSTAIHCQHNLAATRLVLSLCYLALEIQLHTSVMQIAVPERCWQTYQRLIPAQLAQTLLRIAAHVDPRRLRASRGFLARALRRNFLCWPHEELHRLIPSAFVGKCALNTRTER